MVEGYTLFNVSLGIGGIVLCLVSLIMVLIGYWWDNNVKEFFMVFCVCLLADLICNTTGELLIGKEGSVFRILTYVMFFLHFLLSPTLGYIITWHLLKNNDPGRKKKVRWTLLIVLFVIHVALQVVSLFNGMFFYIDEYNISHKGNMYGLMAVLSMLPLFIYLYTIIEDRKNYTKYDLTIMSVYVVVPMVAVIIQSFVTGLRLIVPATTITLFVMIIIIIYGQAKKSILNQKKQAELQISIMLSQIQPHFLYNALDSIYYLCGKDAEKAQSAIADFSKYLRINLDSLKNQEPVPFVKEKQHVETYLKLEKMSMEDNLEYSFDCEAEDFMIPVLTIQPLVENAVKHGLSEKAGGGSVSIKTRKNEDSITIIVEDDGIGFDADQYESETEPQNEEQSQSIKKIIDKGIEIEKDPHVAIDNVRSRIENQCGGRLEIKSEVGKGTVAMITIPIR